jgi:hypothetical protein
MAVAVQVGAIQIPLQTELRIQAVVEAHHKVETVVEQA